MRRGRVLPAVAVITRYARGDRVMGRAPSFSLSPHDPITLGYPFMPERPLLKRWLIASQFTVFHQASRYSGRRFWYLR
jgi:hypothetical protein